MISINSQFDKVVCISLMEREDKRIKMIDRFNKLGIETTWHRPVIHTYSKNIVKALVDTHTGYFNVDQPNEINTSFEHYTIIKTAYIEGVQKLCVFEDDVMFHQDFETLFPKYMDKVPADWNMLMFYSFMYNIEPQNAMINSRWMRAYKSWSLMAYVMDRTMMLAYINEQDRLFQIADLATYNLCERKDLNIYVARPTLCIPDTEMDSNIRKTMNYKATNTVLNMGINNEMYK